MVPHAGPFKYRSLQLTGQEKKLYSLSCTKLFGLNRLTRISWAVPQKSSLWPGKRYRTSRHWLSLNENAGPFAVARTVLAKMADPPYGIVGYGGGTRFERSVPHLQTIGRPIDQDTLATSTGMDCASRWRVSVPPTSPDYQESDPRKAFTAP
jgi:hypothetical protein